MHPRLHHLGLTTSNLDTLVEWYRKVLGMGIVHRTSAAAGGKEGVPGPIIASPSFQLPGLNADPDRSHHHQIQHFAFECQTLDDLLGTYTRLKGLGIALVLCTGGGSQTAFYYGYPDRNSVELNVDNYGDCWTSSEHMRTSAEFAKNPMGTFIDPDKMIVARNAGALPYELHRRAWTGEFAPPKPYDPRVLL